MQPDSVLKKEARKSHLPLRSKKVNQVSFTINSIEAAKAALPIFGGTTPEGANQSPPASGPAAVIVAPQSPPEDSPNQDGSKPEASKEDPIEKLSKDPNALGQLLAQVDKLTKDLTDSKNKVNQYETKQQEEARKQQTREQQLESDLAERDATIQQMDAVIRNMAIGNAFLANPDIKWHSVKQAMAELRTDAFDIDVDLANGTATVNGIDNEVKRIAKDCPWLVAKATSPEPPGPRAPRSSGAPPAPPGTDVAKQARRNELMKKFPVIAHGARI